ncbi:MAG: sigma-70 family RNA polymerase sigma factor [Fibrobacter sp.]|nr:sigma-70 family RNA polymerase sigma factor [Fibrobacter sp.]
MLHAKKKRNSGVDFDLQLEHIACYDTEFERFEVRSIVDHLFKKQSVSTRTIATFHYVDELTLEETAEVCGMSVSGIRKRLNILSKNLTSLRDYQNEIK